MPANDPLPPADAGPVDCLVRPLPDDAQVMVSIYGRLQTLQMTWARARDMYVRHFGIDAIQDCRAEIEAGRQWKGYTDPERRTWMAVVRAA